MHFFLAHPFVLEDVRRDTFTSKGDEEKNKGTAASEEGTRATCTRTRLRVNFQRAREPGRLAIICPLSQTKSKTAPTTRQSSDGFPLRSFFLFSVWFFGAREGEGGEDYFLFLFFNFFAAVYYRQWRYV